MTRYFFYKKARYVIWPNSIVTSVLKIVSMDHAAKRLYAEIDINDWGQKD